MSKKQTYLSGFLVHHVKKFLMQGFCTNAVVKVIYLSYRDAIIIVIEKMLLIFILFHKIQYDQAINKNLMVFNVLSSLNLFSRVAKLASDRDN